MYTGYFYGAFWSLADVLCEKICIVAVNRKQICCMFASDLILSQFKRNTIMICVCLAGQVSRGVKCRPSARSARGNVMSQRA